MDFNCVICLEDIINFNDKKTLECEHMYHKECISNIINNKCPLCNNIILENSNDKIERLENENNNLTKINKKFINEVKYNIDKSINKYNNKYIHNMTNHYEIIISFSPLKCKYCNFKTSKYGYIYNHIFNIHYNKLQFNNQFRNLVNNPFNNQSS